MSQITVQLLSLSTRRPLPGFTVHFLDLSEASVPEQAGQPLVWNGLHAEGWGDLAHARLGSALTDMSGVAQLRCPSSPPGTLERTVNLWVYACGGRPDETGLSNVVSVSREVRSAPGPHEVYQLWVAADRMQPVAPRRVISSKFPKGVGPTLARQTQRLPDTLKESAQPTEVTAILEEFDRARSEAGTSHPRSFQMAVAWAGDAAGIEHDPASGALVRRDAAGAATPLRLAGIARQHMERGRSKIAIDVAANGNLTLMLPAVPDRLEKIPSDWDPLLRYFEATNDESGLSRT